MNDPKPQPLRYESKRDFETRKRWITDWRREAIRIALWIIGFVVAGLALSAFFAAIRQPRAGDRRWDYRNLKSRFSSLIESA
jgi:hypothetical protein